MKRIAMVAALGCVLGAQAASAAPYGPPNTVYPESYEAIAFAAPALPGYGSNGGHAFHFSNGVFGSNTFIFDFDAGIGAAGSFIKNADGTATLTGHVVAGRLNDNGTLNFANANLGWNVSLSFQYIGDGQDGTANVKAELADSAYIAGFTDNEVGTATCVGTVGSTGVPCVDPDELWSYFDLSSATLTGTDDLSGIVLALAAVGPKTQSGVGANGKNLDTGLSLWFDWSVVENSTQLNLAGGSYHGDVNIDWDVVVPEPATLGLFGAALLGLGGLRRRRRV